MNEWLALNLKPSYRYRISGIVKGGNPTPENPPVTRLLEWTNGVEAWGHVIYRTIQ